MKPIQTYQDYRLFLKEYYRQSKLDDPTFTFALFAKRAGVGSPNYLKLVMDGQRNLSVESIHAFAKALKLDGVEHDFFEALVQENQAETTLVKRYYRQRLRKLSDQGSQKFARRRTSNLIDSSLKSALLLCAQDRSLSLAAKFAETELGLTHAVAQNVFQILIREGQLTLDHDGFLRLASAHTMVSDPKGLSERQRRFLKEGLDDAQAAFDRRYPKGAAKFLSLILTAPTGSLPDLFSDLKSAVESIAEKYDPQPTDESGVYRMQFQVYRMRKDAE